MPGEKPRTPGAINEKSLKKWQRKHFVILVNRARRPPRTDRARARRKKGGPPPRRRARARVKKKHIPSHWVPKQKNGFIMFTVFSLGTLFSETFFSRKQFFCVTNEKTSQHRQTHTHMRERAIG